MNISEENSEQVSESENLPPLLDAPRHPFTEVVTSRAGLADVCAQLQSGTGEIALDAERASGYRYSQRAYLIQIFRRGGGLHLIDPIAFPESERREIFTPLHEILCTAEVVIHASSQDLPCLREIGISPTRIFDTELAARIAGFPRVGLGALTESLLNFRLAKEHSAVDWSQRPLHHDWLIYAALDVDVLLDLKDEIVRVLEERKKIDWARQESQAMLEAPPAPARKEPWRRTSGIHQVKRPEQLALIRELWITRDALARERDIAAGRILNDRALVNIVMKNPKSSLHVQEISAAKKDASHWWSAIERAHANPHVPRPAPTDGPPAHMRVWKERAPIAYARLTHARARLAQRAQELELPVENLLSPDAVKRFCWDDPPPGGRSESDIERLLSQWGARAWQITFAAPILRTIEGEREPLLAPDSPDEVSELS